MRRRLAVLSLVLLWGCGDRRHGEPTVAAAASLRKVLPELADAAHVRVKLVFGASGTLAKEVESGAPIDGVVFAAKTPVDGLVAAKKAHDETIVATNRLVLVGEKGAPPLTFQT